MGWDAIIERLYKDGKLTDTQVDNCKAQGLIDEATANKIKAQE